MVSRNSSVNSLSLVAEAESTLDGAIEMAAAKADISSIDLIHRALKASGKSQEDLAQLFDVSQQRISGIFNNEMPIRVIGLARILRACGYQLVLHAEPVNDGLDNINPVKRTREGSKKVSE